MTEEEKNELYDQLPEEIRQIRMSLSLMSDGWSRDLGEILDAVLWDRDVKKVFELKHKLSKRVDDRIAIAKDEGRLSALPKEVLEELIRDLKQIDQWKYKVESMLYEALRLQK